MKKLFTLVSAAMLCMQSFAFDYSSNPGSNKYVDEWGKLKLVGNQLSNEKGEPIQLRGWSTHGSWFKHCFDEKSDFQKMKDQGANLARIAMYITEGEGVNKAWVKDCIDWTAELNMYCLVDWHVLTPGNPNASGYSGYNDFFSEMTSYVKQKGYKHVLWEICNEPNQDVDGAPAAFHNVWEWVKKYADNVLPTIAQNCPDAIVMVGTPQWDQDVTVAFQDPIQKKDSFKDLQLMYSFHHYAANQQRYLGIFSAATAFVPVFITEWGLSTYTGDGAIDTKAADHMIQVANGQNLGGQVVSWANWSWADKGETSGTFTGGGYNNLSFSEAGNYIKDQLKKGDVRTSCKPEAYEVQVFDGKTDFILDLGKYDKGGQDNAYFDYDEDWACPGNNKNNEMPCNAGDAGKDGFRPGDFFDIGYSDKNDKANAYKTLGYIGNGEWITYTIDVKKAGDYEFEVLACDHKDYNTFAIAVDGKPGLVTENGDDTEFQALYLQTCKGGDENGDYNIWDWVVPSNAYNTNIKHRLHFAEAGEHKLTFAFMTSFSGMGSFKIKGKDNSAVDELVANDPVIAPNPAEGGVFNVTVFEDATVKVVNSLGAVVYSANVEANSTASINLNANSGIYFVSVVGETNATTQKLIVK